MLSDGIEADAAVDVGDADDNADVAAGAEAVDVEEPGVANDTGGVDALISFF